MPGPVLPLRDPIPDWVKPEHASVFDSNLTKALRMIAGLIGADNPTSQMMGLMGTEIAGGPSGGLVGAVQKLAQRAKAMDTAKEILYRGESTANRGAFGAGRHYTPDLEFARQFTQTGRESEVLKAAIDPAHIFTPETLPFAGDVQAVDAAITQAKSGGFKAIRLSEGAGQPQSVFVFDRSAIDPEKVIKAYHGSPHDFPAERLIRRATGEEEYIVGRPDVLPDVPQGATVLKDFPLGRARLDKIGTGEGAQAYGHGLYGAEAEGTARTYRDDLSRPVLKYKGFDFPEPVKGRAFLQLNDEQVRDEAAREIITRTQKQLRYGAPLDVIVDVAKGDARVLSSKGDKDYWLSVEKRIEEMAPDLQVHEGKMYEWAIKADPDQFLDWDKPLSQQSEQIRQAVVGSIGDVRPVRLKDGSYSVTVVSPEGQGRVLHAVNESSPDAAMSAFQTYVTSAPGGAAYHEVAAARNFAAAGAGREASAQASATQAMRKAGIPGIKYLDQGSRSTGEGTRNYVVFDDSLIEILRKYGLIPPATAGMLGQQQDEAR